MAFYHDMNKKKTPPQKRAYGAEEGTRYRSEIKENKSSSDRRNKKHPTTGLQEEHRRLDRNPGDRLHHHSAPGRMSVTFTDSSRTQPFEKREKSFRDYEYNEPEVRKSLPGHRDDLEERYVLTGRNPIREALKNHRDLEKLLVQKGELSGSAKEIVQKAKEQKVLVQVVEKSRLDEIAPQHQGLIAFASAYQYATVEDILNTAKEKGEKPFIIILDGLTDPHNLGAIIRTAECTGVHGVIVPQHRSVGLTPAAVKASAGAVEYIKVARVTNLNRTIEELQKKDIWVYALTMEGTDIDKVNFDGGTALVIGAEGDGISQLTETKCDLSVSIPMSGHLDSLNASVAAGIVMYRVMMSRKNS